MDTAEIERRLRAQTGRVPHETFVSALLRNPVRSKIMTLLKRKPGMNRSQLARRLNMHENAIGFHLDRLIKAHLVVTRPGWDGREILCFTADNVSLWEQPETRILFGRGPPRKVARYLAEHPGTGTRQVAEALGLSANTVRRHLRTLEENDLVQRMRVDREVIYHAQPALVRWFEVAEKDDLRGIS